MKLSHIGQQVLHALLAVACVLSLSRADGEPIGLTQKYCSNQNTGSSFNKVFNTWQSNGACYQTCVDSYAFAVIQGQYCWCSNYIPANQLSVSSCSDSCPGYPDERCGSSSSNLYGYIALRRPAFGTAGSSAAASSTQASRTIQAASTSQPPSSTQSPSSSQASLSSTQAPSSTKTPTPVTSIVVVTISGAIVTQTVTSTPAAPAEGSLQPVRAGLSGGAIAGVVMGTLVGLAALAAAMLFFLLRRRGNNAGGDAESSKPSGPQRNTSVLSRTGLLSQDKLDPLVIPATWRHSNTTNLDSDGVSPMDEKRISKPLVYDQRLNPSALLQHDNGSRASVGTMQDHRDYARPLKVSSILWDRLACVAL
ncbi:Wsc4-like protein [Cryomyces antarcticus]